jgi:hypothetical protein
MRVKNSRYSYDEDSNIVESYSYSPLTVMFVPHITPTVPNLKK